MCDKYTETFHSTLSQVRTFQFTLLKINRQKKKINHNCHHHHCRSQSHPSYQVLTYHIKVDVRQKNLLFPSCVC